MVNYRDIKVDFRLSPTACINELSPHDLVIPVLGMIKAWDDTAKDYLKIGLIHALIMKARLAVVNNLHPIEVVNQTSEALTSLYNEFFVDGETHPEVLREVSSASYDDNMLYIKQLDVMKDHQGRGIGLIALHAMMTNFNQDLIFLKAFPMQYADPDVADDEIENEWKIPLGKAVKYEDDDFDRHQSKLFKHYGKIGFRRIKNTEYMILNGKKELISLSDLIGEKSFNIPI